MEHTAQYETKPAGPNIVMDWVVCSCGWAHMVNARHWAPGSTFNVLRRVWWHHAYTKEEQSILRELGGEDGILY